MMTHLWESESFGRDPSVVPGNKHPFDSLRYPVFQKARCTTFTTFFSPHQKIPRHETKSKNCNMSTTCRLEVNTLAGRKVLFEHVAVNDASIENVFEMVKSVEDPETQWKLMVVVKGRLVPMHWADKDRKLHELGIQGNGEDDAPYRVEVCLAWNELKKVLT